MNKCMWFVVRPSAVTPETFRELLVRDVGPISAKLLHSTAEAWVLPQEPDQFSNATVNLGDGEQPFDASISVTTSDSFVPLDDFTAYLRETCRYVAGWRVCESTMYDSRSPRAIGELSEQPTLNIFLERADGTTPEFFTRNWYIHGGHSDGEEAENDDARASRELGEQAKGQLYLQNRVLEPIAQTPWVTHGIGVLTLPVFPTSDFVDAGDHGRNPGEAPFDRWPPRILQGYQRRVL